MEEARYRRIYTVEDAREMIPRARTLLAAMQLEHRRLHDELRRLNRLTPAMQSNGHAPDVFEHEKLILELGQSIRQKLDEFEELGIEVKDIAAGVIDFPSMRDGRVVYLCWMIDEPTVTHWHEVDDGFAGRQALDE